MTHAEKAELAGLEASACLYLKGLSVHVACIPSPVEWTAASVRRMRELQGGGVVSVFVPGDRRDSGVCVVLVEGRI